MSDLICRRCRISGRVQGVWYRASTQRQARRLGVTGYARNLPDGQVEVLACGRPEAVERLLVWCRRGPELAQVTAVECVAAAPQELDDFRTG